MFNAHFTAAQRAALLDKIIGVEDFDGSIDFCQVQFAGSHSNPLRTFQRLTTFPDSGFQIESEILGALVGVPASAFEAEALDLPEEQLLPALGRLALLWLESVRQEILREYIKLPTVVRTDEIVPGIYAELIPAGGRLA